MLRRKQLIGSRALPPTLLFVLALVFSGCNTQPTPAVGATGFEFYVDPQTEQVTLLDPTGDENVQANSTPNDSRILVPNTDIALRNFSFEFSAPNKLVIRSRVENITDDLAFAQPFFFTLSSDSENLVRANAPLVTDRQLGGDGVLSPGEKSARFRFEVTFEEGAPFTFLVDTSAVVVGGDTGTACTDPVAIPDDKLKAAVRDALGKSAGDITCAEMASLTELQAAYAEVATLEGLQYAVNLTLLGLYSNDLSDITPLQELTNLTRLELNLNALSDITPLQDLTNLTVLLLSENTISDITPLQNLTNLTVLTLDRNDISDLAPLQGLTSLVALALGENAISDLAPLQNLTNLGELYLDQNAISDLAPLEELVNLTTLELYDNTVSDLAPLRNLTNLGELALDRNGVSDITPLQDLTNLAFLELSENAIRTISALVRNSGLAEGATVNLEGNPLSSQAKEAIKTLEARGVEVVYDED